MKRRSIVGGAAALAASIALAGSALAFEGLTNGSFETGSYADGGLGYEALDASSTDISGWTVASGSIDWVGTYWQAQDGGAMSLDLDGNAPGAITQTLATTVGNSYFVSFYLAGNPNGSAVKTLIVSATGAAPATYTFDTSTTSTTAMGWTVEGYSFVATSASSTLTFASGDAAGDTGPALDNVAVAEIVAIGGNCKDGGWRSLSDGQGNGFKNQGDCVSYFATDGKNAGAVTP